MDKRNYFFLVPALIAALLVQLTQAQPGQGANVNSGTGQTLERALFGMGCFWKTQYVFSKVPGVIKTTVGYTGGKTANPTYEQVCTHTTGHAETVLVEFDPKKVTYRKLLEVFWKNHDPTTLNRQGPDQGDNYRSVIFYTSPEQQKDALAYKVELEKSHQFSAPIVTLIEPAKPFYPAENYHQNYYAKHGNICF